MGGGRGGTVVQSSSEARVVQKARSSGCDRDAGSCVFDCKQNSDGAATEPSLRYVLEPVEKYEADPAIQAIVDNRMLKVVALEKTILIWDTTVHRHREQDGTIVEEARETCLSSKGGRAQQTTVGSMFSGILQERLGLDAVLLDAGCIRANADYPKDFTYARPE